VTPSESDALIGAIDHITSAIDPCSQQRVMKDERLARRNQLVLISMENYERRIDRTVVRRITRIDQPRITRTDVAQGIGDRMGRDRPANSSGVDGREKRRGNCVGYPRDSRMMGSSSITRMSGVEVVFM
jgi:hypothetical protein